MNPLKELQFRYREFKRILERNIDVAKRNSGVYNKTLKYYNKRLKIEAEAKKRKEMKNKK